MAYVLRGCTVFIGDGKIIDKGTVVVDGGRIIKVVKGDLAASGDDRIIDLHGHTLLPGFIDCHTHILLDGSADPLAFFKDINLPAITLRTVKHAMDTIMAGVTTARDMGAIGGVDYALRDAINAGTVRGPRLLVSGLQICMTGGQGWQFGREADGPDEVRKAAREQLKAGCDVVKLMATGGIMTRGVDPGAAQLTVEELRAGVEEAHRAGRKAASHAQGTEGILNSLNAGIDTIEHGFFLNEECASIMIRKNIPMVPTIGLNGLSDLAEAAGVPAYIVEKGRKVSKALLESLKMAREMGITLGMGVDCGTPLIRHGQNLLELSNFVTNGFTATEALIIGTMNGAKILGIDNLVGSIEQGKIADLVAVKGNPVDDINLVRQGDKMTLVMKDGIIVKGD